MLRTHHQLRAIRKSRDRINVHITHTAICIPSLNKETRPSPQGVSFFSHLPKRVKEARDGLHSPLKQDDFSYSSAEKYGKRGELKAAKPEKQSKCQSTWESGGARGRKITIACSVDHPSTPLVGSQISARFSSCLPGSTEISLSVIPLRLTPAKKLFHRRGRP